MRSIFVFVTKEWKADGQTDKNLNNSTNYTRTYLQITTILQRFLSCLSVPLAVLLLACLPETTLLPLDGF